MEAPRQLLLEKELFKKEIKRVLFYYNTDRWYFGDLLRHASWIHSLAEAKFKITVVTQKNFLSIFKNHPKIEEVKALDKIKERDFLKYDLVVIPSSFPPSYYSPLVKRGIYSYNDGIQYTRFGSIIKTILKSDLNYFRLASHKFGQLYLSDGGYYKIHLENKETISAGKILDRIFGTQKIIVLNPSASNFFTRGTKIKKEVLNQLSLEDYICILNNLLITFPEYSILVASSLKPGDQENFSLMEKIGRHFKNDRVKSVANITNLGKGLSFRLFASLIADHRIKGMFGNGTGSNTHFAEMFNLPSMSLERGADRFMERNWKSKDSFQMGSFRWRNPGRHVAVYVLNQSKNIDFKNVCETFKRHLLSMEKKWEGIFDPQKLDQARHLTRQLLKTIHSEKKLEKVLLLLVGISKVFADAQTRKFYFNFYDEERYLAIIKNNLKNYIRFLNNLAAEKLTDFPGETLKSEDENLLINLFIDSNLYKLLCNFVNINSKEIYGKNDNESAPDKIFKKIRIGQSLSPKEILLLRFQKEEQFCEWINRAMEKKIKKLIKNFKIKNEYRIADSWQQGVFENHDKKYLLKIIDINKKSIYFTGKWTLDSLYLANKKAGGLIPHQTRVIKISGKYYHLARRVRPLLYDSSAKRKILNGGIIDIYLSGKTDLPLGWIDEFISNFVELAHQGIYNIDTKLIDAGIDEFGVFYSLDSGSFKGDEVLCSKDVDLKKDFFHLGINELLINRSLLSKFANATEIIRYYDKKIKTITGIELSKFSLNWKWGDHESKSVEPQALQFKLFLKNKFRKTCPKLVYPLISDETEKVVYNLIKKRFRSHRF